MTLLLTFKSIFCTKKQGYEYIRFTINSLLLLIVICTSESIFAQKTAKRPVFSITHTAGITDFSRYESALREAPLFEFMNLNTPTEIVFDNGIRVSLISLKELKEMGSTFEIGSFNTITDLRNYVFYIKSDGKLGWRKTGSAPK